MKSPREIASVGGCAPILGPSSTEGSGKTDEEIRKKQTRRRWDLMIETDGKNTVVSVALPAQGGRLST